MDITVLKKEAKNKKTSANRLIELSKIDVELSRIIAKLSTTPLSVLEELAKCSDMPTRAAVAKHPNSDTKLLNFLATDKQWTILKAIVKHPNVSEESLRRLAQHKQASVRRAVADAMSYHIRLLPSDVVQLLALDRDKEVAHEIFTYNMYLSSKGTAPISDVTLDKMLSDPDPEMRAFYAHKTSYLRFNRTQLERLVADGDIGVRASVATYYFHAPGFNRNDLDLLVKLCQDDEKIVRDAAFRNSCIHLVGKIPRTTKEK